MNSKTESQLRVACRGADVLPLEAIEDFQGGLKKRTGREIGQIITSLLRFGFSFPFFIWASEGRNWCLDGHGRLAALAELRRRGFELPLFPVVWVEAADQAEAKQKLLRLNSQYGQLTLDSLQAFMGELELEAGELALPGGLLDLSGLDREAVPTVGDDEAPALAPAADSQPGELYELGPHLLACGDGSDPEVLERLMGASAADLWLTDPPYNVAYEGKTAESLTIANDRMDGHVFGEFLTRAFRAAAGVTKPGAVFYIWHADTRGWEFRSACRDAGLTVRQCLIWNKNSLVIGRQDYQWKHEPCLYGWKDGAGHLWASDRRQTTVLNFDRPMRSAEHPTMKPADLFAYLIQNNTKGEDLVLDNFAGSGTTLIASAKTGRVARLAEIDPRYCDVIRRRWTVWARENGHEPGPGILEPLAGEAC